MDEFDESERDLSPGPQITLALFAKWRNARRGEINGQRLTNPVWDWLIRTQLWPYGAGQHFGDAPSVPISPRWCFARFGMSQTILPDGRKLFVAGEHEDHYDPDFFIYNDVIVRHPDDSIDVFGYSVDDFPPTDFHSATWVDGRVLLIGSLGYPELRNPAVTQCLSLDVGSMRITQLQTTGANPGWIYDHSAELVDGRILIRSGKVERKAILENVDDWQLDLQTLCWSRLTDRQWPQLTFCRADGKANRLWEIRSHLFDLQIAESGYAPPDSQQRLVRFHPRCSGSRSA